MSRSSSPTWLVMLCCTLVLFLSATEFTSVTAQATCQLTNTCGGPACSNDTSCGGTLRGVCNATSGLCNCTSPNYVGANNCSLNKINCTSNCGGARGSCNFLTGLCVCFTGFQGADCSIVACPLVNGNPCNNHGQCDSLGICVCNAGWVGSSCTIELKAQGMTSGDLAAAVVVPMIITTLVIGMILFIRHRNKGDDDECCDCT